MFGRFFDQVLDKIFGQISLYVLETISPNARYY